MDVIACSKAEADSQLQQIRKGLGVEGDEQTSPIRVLASLNRTLKVISDQLYQTPTHFLLELIQNADDNHYQPYVVPSLVLSLYESDSKRYFHTDCNEVGFTLGQIDSLTDVVKSTKRVDKSSGQKGYIGEKGIGFKSVFKVADVVHIASGHYQFELDRNQPIGMILPIPSPFPYPRADLVSSDKHHTQFLLEVKRNDDFLEIERQLKKLNPELLLFLRKLKQLRLSFPDNRRFILLVRSVHLSNRDLGGGGGVEMITLKASIGGIGPGGNMTQHREKKYVIYRHEVRDLPSDPVREGVSASEAILAFPFRSQTDNGCVPVIESHKTFAFLPINDFGFKFAIHADFLLVASREALEERRPWNLALRDGIRDAFLAAMQGFAFSSPEDQLGGFRFTWPKYLTRTPHGSEFWDELYADIIKHLRQRPLLASQHGPPNKFCNPSTLRYVPTKYRFHGRTLFEPLSDESSHDHLSFQYDDVWSELEQLGVQPLSLDELCTEFEQWLARVDSVVALKARPLAWHEHVSRLFYGCNPFLQARLKALPIIPLCDGAWSKVGPGQNIYLESPFHDDDSVPGNLDMFIVNPVASRNKARREFFEFLGINQYTPRQVGDLILKLHRDPNRGISRTAENLILDAAYLFKHRSLLRWYFCKTPNIFFAVTRNGERANRKVGPIYYDDPRVQPNLINRYKSSAGNPFWVLDDGYEAVIFTDNDPSTQAQKQQEFPNWLLQSPTISQVPELVRNHQLTPEWEFLRDANVIDLLHALKSRYGSSAPEVVPVVLLQAVQQLQVWCRDGSQRRLGDLALPTEELLRECPNIDFVDLSEAGSTNSWEFLSRFGVLCTCDTTARLRELQALSERFQPGDVSKEAVHGIYRSLNSDGYRENKDKVRAFFNNNRVVLIPDGEHSGWICHDRCVWNAPPLLQQVVRLRPYYQDCERLFTQILEVRPASLGEVVHEFCSSESNRGNEKSAVQRFEKLLLLLADFESKGPPWLCKEELMRIRAAPVFPVIWHQQKVDDAPQDNPAAIMWRSMDEGGWNIPDDIFLESLFRGMVYMLGMPVRSIIKSADRLKELFVALGCTEMLLSVSVEQTVELDGDKVRALSVERELKIRVQHLSQLPRTTDATDSPHALIQVWRVPSIAITRRLGDVEITADDGLLKVHKNDIYLPLAIPPHRQAELNYELGCHFAKLLGIEKASVGLLNLLMSAPANQLTNILQRHNIEPPSCGEISSGEADDNIGLTGFPAHFAHYPEDVGSASDAREGWGGNDSMPLALGISAGSSNISTLTLPIRPRVGGGQGSVIDHPSTARALISPEAELRRKKIGFRGERHVYHWFEHRISDWTFANWTSKLRSEAGYPEFMQSEKDFSDFTYRDTLGYMKTELGQLGIETEAGWSRSTTYHLEVKTTTGAANEPFFASQIQVDMMRTHDGDPENVYILLRVFKVDGDRPGMVLYPNPWRSYMDRLLEFKSVDGYTVYSNAEVQNCGMVGL